MKQHADGFASSSKSPPKETREMSSQEFIARINALIPSPNEEANKNLLDFGNSLWLRLKEDLFPPLWAVRPPGAVSYTPLTLPTKRIV